jgi:hypothetical protein
MVDRILRIRVRVAGTITSKRVWVVHASEKASPYDFASDKAPSYVSVSNVSRPRAQRSEEVLDFAISNWS